MLVFARMPLNLPWSSRARLLRSYLPVGFVFVLICIALDLSVLRGGKDYWDARVYAEAIGRWKHGLDPYTNASGLPFVYPPLFLIVASWLSRFFPGRAAWHFYLLLDYGAALVLPWMLARTYIRSQWLTPAIAFIFFALEPKLFGEIVTLSGNLSTLLYALLLGAGIPGLRRGRWLLFYLAVFTAALIKPPFLALLLLPLFAGRRQVWPSLACAFAAVSTFALQYLWMPRAFQDFYHAVSGEVIVREDAGMGLFALFLKLGHRFPFFGPFGASVTHAGIIGLLVGGLIVLRRNKDLPGAESLYVPGLLVIAIFANPRMQRYDVCVAMIPAIYISVECMRWAIANRTNPAVPVLAASIFVVLMGNAPLAAATALLVFSILLMLFRLREARVSESKIQPLEEP